MAILITGGTGYIGSHTCVELLNEGQEIIVVDNCKNSKPEVVQRIQDITGKHVFFYQTDLLSQLELDAIFREHEIESVIHFAGSKAVAESVRYPLQYYQNNITGTLVLCEVMYKYAVKKMVFSSTATVYGASKGFVDEKSLLNPINPYGRSKLMIEQILTDLCATDPNWSIAILRYFNPVGAHESGKIGEEPRGTPQNLMPLINLVASGILKRLKIYGADYDTNDGTGVRDYIHVIDLAKGHLKALDRLNSMKGIEDYNLGTGVGYSVLELVKHFESTTGMKVPHVITDRREGDVDICVANPNKAKNILQWETTKSIEDMCRDSWRWQLNIMKESSNKSREVTMP